MEEITRLVDDLGRVVIPVHMRKARHIKPGDKVIIADTRSGILIKSANICCSICGYDKFLIAVKSGYLCPECAGTAKYQIENM